VIAKEVSDDREYAKQVGEEDARGEKPPEDIPKVLPETHLASLLSSIAASWANAVAAEIWGCARPAARIR
jgi:hypothetical protein